MISNSPRKKRIIMTRVQHCASQEKKGVRPANKGIGVTRGIMWKLMVSCRSGIMVREQIYGISGAIQDPVYLGVPIFQQMESFGQKINYMSDEWYHLYI